MSATMIQSTNSTIAVFAMLTFLLAGPAVANQYGNPTAYRLEGVTLKQTKFSGEPALQIAMPASRFQDPEREKLTDRRFMAWLPIPFKDGTVEVDLASTLAPDAPAYARGFLGVSFRIGENGTFENIYLRPVNSGVTDQVRRNHTIQYFAYPDYPFTRLRSESPEKYETWADIALDQWTHVKITVLGSEARLYLNHAVRPSFVVTDLKLGPDARGGIGIWIESGTVGYFKGLSISPH